MKTIFDAAFFKFLLGFAAVIFIALFLLGETRNYLGSLSRPSSPSPSLAPGDDTLPPSFDSDSEKETRGHFCERGASCGGV